jgi:hypothetical protein
MAFSEAQLGKLVRITGIQITPLNFYISGTEASQTTAMWAETQTQVGELILEYFPASGTGAGRKFTRYKAKDRNFGAEKDPGEHRAAIRKEIGDLLGLTEYMPISGQTRLVRS